MDEKITITVNRTSGDPNKRYFSSTTNVYGPKEDLDRMLTLAGLSSNEIPVDTEFTEVPTNMLSNDHTEDCECEDCCRNCASEGWLENQFSNGSVDVDVYGPDDMVDVDFDTEQRRLGETAVNDFGHNDYSEHGDREITAFDYKGRPESSTTSFRYTKANYADNPMTMEEEDFVDMGDDEEQSYNDELNSIVNQIKSDIGMGAYTGDNTKYAKIISKEYGIPLQKAEQEIVDQFVLIYGEEPSNYMEEPIGESVSNLKESIAILAENTSNHFMSALEKIKCKKANSLTEAEITNIAAAFINIMRQTDTAKVVRLHECVSEYINGSLADAYRKYKKDKK